MRQIYLDYNATTPVDPEVTKAIVPFLEQHYGNPSSNHSLGRAAHEAIEDARAKVAGLVGASKSEIVFTGGGTEASNMAIKGIMIGPHSAKGHMVTSAIEHPATLQPANYCETFGCDVTVVGCNEQGVVEPQSIADAIRPDTKLVSIMHANNEIGTIQPIREIANICHDRAVILHTDAAQSIGKIPANVDQLDVDLMTIAGHKFYAPKGVGALFIRDGLGLESLLHGAGHENGLRAGTENTPYIVGLGKAAVIAAERLDEFREEIELLREHFWKLISQNIPNAFVHGCDVDRLPNTISIAFPGVFGHELLQRVPEVCASLGSACHSSGDHRSGTLGAMGVVPGTMMGTIRFSLGRSTSKEGIERAAMLMVDAWENLAF